MGAIVLTGVLVLPAYGAAQVSDGAPAAVVTIRVPGVTRWEVRALAPSLPQWLEEWPRTALMPRAVAITMWHDSTPLGLPLQVRVLAGAPWARGGSIRQ